MKFSRHIERWECICDECKRCSGFYDNGQLPNSWFSLVRKWDVGGEPEGSRDLDLHFCELRCLYAWVKKKAE